MEFGEEEHNEVKQRSTVGKSQERSEESGEQEEEIDMGALCLVRRGRTNLCSLKTIVSKLAAQAQEDSPPPSSPPPPLPSSPPSSPL